MSERYETLDVTADGGVLHVTLNRPQARNAMTMAMVRELRTVLADARQSGDVRVLVLRGAGGHFCAGADPLDMAAAQERAMRSDDDKRPPEPAADPIAEVHAKFGELCVAYADTGLATVAVLEGMVTGGGFGLACVVDVAIASETVQFSLPETTLGVVPAHVGPFLVERVGYAETKRLAITGGTLDARQALALRLVHEVHAPAALDAALRRVLDTILHGAPGAISATKALLARARFTPAVDLVHEASAVYSRAVRSAEGLEGAAASLARRKPRWAP